MLVKTDFSVLEVTNTTAYVPLFRQGNANFKKLISRERGRKMNVKYGVTVAQCGRSSPCPKGKYCWLFSTYNIDSDSNKSLFQVIYRCRSIQAKTRMTFQKCVLTNACKIWLLSNSFLSIHLQ